MPYSIVCVHIGNTIPSHLEIALAQARLFNPDCPLILIAEEKALQKFNSCSHITSISCESLPITPEHTAFRNRTKLNDQFLDGYLRYTSERFLYLYDYMAAFNAENVFHIENDVLLYEDLGKLLPLFQAHYPAIAATFESEHKCIPGFVFVANAEAMQKLADFFALKASKALADMQVIALFRKEHKNLIDCLPMIMESYLIDHVPSSFENRLLKKKKWHSNHIVDFNSLFDGAAIGVFFDGLDSSKGNFPPGHIMKELFDPSLLDYTWCEDEKGRKTPYAHYGNAMYRINNLHIASKRLEKFTSR